MKNTASLIYIGKGAFLPGVPARDLTADEAEKFGRMRLLESGLYKNATPEKPAPAVSDARKDPKEK